MLGNGVDLEVQIKSIDARTPAGIKVVSKALEAPICQFALNRDPGFASNSNPVMRGVR
jgi:hypothetical protein